MHYRRLKTVLQEFQARLNESRQIAFDASLWVSPGAASAKALITPARREQLVQLAFLRAFLAWEGFLEESFVLYLAGQMPPKGRRPSRYAFPPNLKVAKEWLKPEGRPFAEWTNPDIVSDRAQRFFRGGRPYTPVLSSNRSALNEANTLRNAIAHQSEYSQSKFETLVRDKLGAYPKGLTVGGFLCTLVLHSSPPVDFFESYLEKLEIASRRLVPV